jgi:hypothetical protein
VVNSRPSNNQLRAANSSTNRIDEGKKETKRDRNVWDREKHAGRAELYYLPIHDQSCKELRDETCIPMYLGSTSQPTYSGLTYMDRGVIAWLSKYGRLPLPLPWPSPEEFQLPGTGNRAAAQITIGCCRARVAKSDGITNLWQDEPVSHAVPDATPLPEASWSVWPV